MLLKVGMILAVLVSTTGLSSPSSAEVPSRRVTAWLPWWDQDRGLEAFRSHSDLFHAISPFWYEMQSSASLVSYPGARASAVIDAARSAGVAVIPTITNDFDGARVATMLATSESRRVHVQALLGLVTKSGYDGIDVDYENLAAADRARYSSFITELGAALHSAGKQLTVAVHPKTSEPGSWSGPQAQDYAAIGAAADRVRVMAYDYHWATSPAGPIAPLGWVEEVATFAASVIPPSKVELGIGLYGYDWVGTAGTGLTFDMVMARRAANGAMPRWSDASSAPWFTYRSKGQDHTVWYEDARSVGLKLAVSDRLGLAGVALWRLGGEDPGVWSAVRSRWGAASANVLPPTAPSGLVARALLRAVDLTWAPSTDASGVVSYNVYRAIASGGPFVRVATTTSTTHRDASLRKKTTYWYRVTAIDGSANETVPSAAVSARAL